MHVLFVCTGNVCRSPTAERLAAEYGERHRLVGFSSSSAGTRAAVGSPIDSRAASVLCEFGCKTTEFAARQLTPRIASAADLVITMTKAHRDVVLELAPRQLARTFTLTEAARLAERHRPADVAHMAELRSTLVQSECPDIPDPIGESGDVFAAVGRRIAALLPPVLEVCRQSPSR